MSPKQPFWFHLNWVFHSHVRSFDPKGVFVDFSKGPIMSKFISFLSEYFELVRWIWFIGNCILLKMSFVWKFSDKVWRSYAWSKLGWLLLRNPNLTTFGFWWIWSIPWGIMINHWSNDGSHFKILMLTQNLEVWLYVGHNWLLT